MAKGTTEAEREQATTVIIGDQLAPDDDVESAFYEFRQNFDSGEQPGLIRAYEIPIDERGNVLVTAKNQIRLGSWPIDLYGFDELCAMLIRDFMPATKVLAVRLIGTKAGQAGIRFNKIVVLRAPKESPPPNGAAAPESTASIMRAIQENNEKLIAQFRPLLAGAAPPQDTMAELQRMMTFSRAMNEPMMTMLGALLPALAGRPAPAAGVDPFAQLSGMVDVFGKLNDLRGGGGSDADPDSIGGIVTALAPVAKSALEAIPSIMASRQPARPMLPRPPQPPRPPSAPGAAPTQPNPTAQPTPPPPQPVQTVPLGDIPSGDQQMFAQLKPQIDTLIQMAGQGSDPDGAADLLFDGAIMELPDELYGRLGDLIGGDKFITYAATLNPGVNAHADWFRKFQARIIERYNAEDVAAQGGTPPVLPPVPPADNG